MNLKTDIKDINAMPTRALFVYMLTKDIPLIPAILDLVDNCSDGAKKLRGEGSLEGLTVQIKVTPEEFYISDNCGGFSIDTAQKYAFRFGRPSGAPSVNHSIGQFGVGMKRALFKLGTSFEVESTTDKEHFVIAVNVDDWVNEPDPWTFKFTQVEPNLKNVPKEKQGATISVKPLREEVSREFKLGNFLQQLKMEIQSHLQIPISRGLSVVLNGIHLVAKPLMVYNDSRIAPAFLERKYPKGDKNPVYVRMYCGVGLSKDVPLAGWHIYCNGRLILEGDKTSVTGWGEKGDINVPLYHPQYNYFRGFVFFDSDDAGKLPWNTTKTGLNTDSAIYKSVLQDMIGMMQPVLSFLRSLAAEKGETESGVRSPLEKILDSSQLVPVEKTTTRIVFVPPTVPKIYIPTGPPMQNISGYSKPLEIAKKVRAKLGATSWRAVGEKTFDYFYKAEFGE
jgi:hypothetical protein